MAKALAVALLAALAVMAMLCGAAALENEVTDRQKLPARIEGCSDAPPGALLGNTRGAGQTGLDLLDRHCTYLFVSPCISSRAHCSP